MHYIHILPYRLVSYSSDILFCADHAELAAQVPAARAHRTGGHARGETHAKHARLPRHAVCGRHRLPERGGPYTASSISD